MRIALAAIVLAPLVGGLAAGLEVPSSVTVRNAPPSILAVSLCEPGLCVTAADANGARDLCPAVESPQGRVLAADGAELGTLRCVASAGTQASLAGPLPAGAARILIEDRAGATAEADVPIAAAEASPPRSGGLLAALLAALAALVGL